MSQKPPSKSSSLDPKLPDPKTKAGKFTQQLLLNIWETLDILGQGMMGDLWRTVYLSLQDAIALSVLLKIPSLIGHIIIGKDFASFDVCLQESPLGVPRYACNYYI